MQLFGEEMLGALWKIFLLKFSGFFMAYDREGRLADLRFNSCAVMGGRVNVCSVNVCRWSFIFIFLSFSTSCSWETRVILSVGMMGMKMSIRNVSCGFGSIILLFRSTRDVFFQHVYIL